MSEMVERVAKALWENSQLKPYHVIDVAPATAVPESGPDWQRFVPVAREVIKAMREPSDAMVSSGLPVADMDSGHPEDIWRAMIDAALEE